MPRSGDVMGLDNEVPPAMASFLSSRGAARGRSVKAQVELQDKINQTSKKIQERWAQLEKDWRKLEKERRDSAATHGITGGGGPIVELNVGGTDMDVLRADLVRAEDSVLADMFSGRWEGRLPRDARGRVFLDVSPTCFRKVVGFLVKLGIAKPGKVLDLPTLTADEQPQFDHLVLVLGLWPHVYEGRAVATPQSPSSSQPRVEEAPVPQVDHEDIKKFGKAVATTFASEELALKKADEEFHLARQRFDQEVAAINAFAGAPAGFGRDGVKDDIVELNIGGMMASTRRSTLCRSSDSVLARMFDHSNERRAPPFVRDSKGRYFVQYNDYCFAKIIEVLRMKRWPWPPTASALNLPSGSRESGFSEGPTRFRIYVREDEREDFSSLVAYFFPGCEKFIMEVVGRSSGGEPLRSPALKTRQGPTSSSSSSSSPPPRSSSRKGTPSGSGMISGSGSGNSSGKSRSKPAHLPSEISVLEIRVGRVRHIKPLPRKSTQYVIKVQVHSDKEEGEFRSVLWHFRTPAPPVNTPVTVLCNLPYIKHEGTTFTAVILCMDDDLLLPPPDAPVGELVTVKNHPPTPSRNGSAVSIVWEKVLSDELLQVGDDEVVRFEHKRHPGPLMTSKGPITCR